QQQRRHEGSEGAEMTSRAARGGNHVPNTNAAPNGSGVSARRAPQSISAASRGPHGLRLRALRPGADLEGHLLTLFEHLVTAHVDGGVVDEDVLPSTLDGDESVALFSVEPLHGSVRHVLLP